MMPVASGLKAVVAGFLEARDRFWSGVWRTEWRIRRNERRLAEALEEFGEDSMPVRQLTEWHRKLEKGAKYWRLSDPVVIRVLEASERAGASRSDLRILAMNRDVFRTRNKVHVRRGWLLNISAIMAVTVVFCGWLMMAIPIATAPIGLPQKVGATVAMTFIFWLIWPGWGLYTTRALGALTRVGDTVERLCERQEVRSAKVSLFVGAD